jgi:hypothetical protein
MDLTLIRWFLSLTPAERVECVEQHMNGVLAARKWNERK